MTVAFERRGQGEPLLLVHGTGSRRQIWAAVLDDLAARHEVIAVDLPGFGETPPLAEAVVTPERYASAVVELLDEMRLGAVHVAGHSLGGGVALVLGALGRARSVTCISPIGFWTPKEADFCRDSIRRAVRLSGLLEPLAPALLGNPVGRTLAMGQLVGRPWRVPAADAIAETAHLARTPGTEPAVAGYNRWRFVPDGPLPCPVTIAWGTHDFLLPYRQAARARRAVPDARHVDLPGCGHTPFWDDTELVTRVLLEGAR